MNTESPKIKIMFPLYLTILGIVLPAGVYFTTFFKNGDSAFPFWVIIGYFSITILIHVCGHFTNLFLKKLKAPFFLRVFGVFASFPLLLFCLAIVAMRFTSNNSDLSFALDSLLLMTMPINLAGISIMSITFHLWVTLPSPFHASAGALWSYTQPYKRRTSKQIHEGESAFKKEQVQKSFMGSSKEILISIACAIALFLLFIAIDRTLVLKYQSAYWADFPREKTFFIYWFLLTPVLATFFYMIRRQILGNLFMMHFVSLVFLNGIILMRLSLVASLVFWGIGFFIANRIKIYALKCRL